MSLPLVLVGLFAAGCGIDAEGTLDVADIKGGSGGVAGNGGGGGSTGEGGMSGAGGASGASGSTGMSGKGGQTGAGGSTGGGGIGGQGGASAGNGGTSGFSGVGGDGAGGNAGSGGISEGGSAGTASGSGGGSGTAGVGGKAGAGGSPDAYAAQTLRPVAGQVLPPTRAYLLWKDGKIPAGKTVAGYDVCSTKDPMTAIDGEDECPNMATVAEPYHVIDGLSAGASYLWKIRAHFSDASISSYGPLGSFSTDHSLAGWWKMDGNVDDSSGAVNDGALMSGAGFGNGIAGEALICNGSSQYADMGTKPGLNLQGPLTLSAWVNGDGIPTGSDTGILSNGALNYALTYHKDGQIWFYIGGGANNVHAPMSPGVWHHVVCVFEGTTGADGMRLYIDGALAAAKTSSVTQTGAAGDLWLGRYDASYFHGSIDDAAIYGAALNEGAIFNDECSVRALSGMAMPALCVP